MAKAGVKPNAVTYNTLADGLVKKGDMARAQDVVERMAKAGVQPDDVTYNTLAAGWVKKGDMARAQDVLERMAKASVQPDVVTWTTLADGWVKKGDMARAQDVVERMAKAGVQPDEVTYCTLIFGFLRAHDASAAEAAFDTMVRLALPLTSRPFNYFVHYFSQRAHQPATALAWFCRMLDDAGCSPNDHTWKCFGDESVRNKALAEYQGRIAKGWRPTTGATAPRASRPRGATTTTTGRRG
jgi:pentatricopeptide repeat protein